MSGSTDPAPTLPGARWSCRAQSWSVAPVDEVWPLIAEAHRWPEWSFLTRADLERTGVPTPDGVGAVRRFTCLGAGSREEVVVWDAPHHLAYAILSGFPVRHHRSDVTLAPEVSGTRITWSTRFDAKIPGTGHLLVPVLTALTQGFATGVARYADRQHGPA